MTLTEFINQLRDVEARGYGTCRMLLSSDAEGNTFKDVDEAVPGRIKGRGEIDFFPAKSKVNAVCVYPV